MSNPSTPPPPPAPHLSSRAFSQNPQSAIRNPQSANPQSAIRNPQSANPQSAIRNPQSANSQSAIRNPQSNLAIFRFVCDLAFAAIDAFWRRNPNPAIAHSLKIAFKVSGCLFSLMRIRVTLLFAPERFDARQVARLAHAAALIERLAGRPINFAPWRALTPEQLIPGTVY